MIKYNLIGDFLTPDYNKELLEWINSLDNWEISRALGDENHQIRKSKSICLNRKNCLPLIKKIENMYEELHLKYYGEKAKLKKIELQLTRSHDGDFYKPHPDKGLNLPEKERKITFVYYLYNEPKKFLDGNIRIYKTDFNSNRYKKNKFIDIPPINNTILFFPSYKWHEVLPIKCHGDWKNSRFTINGCMY